jgi:hypothetical protein
MRWSPKPSEKTMRYLAATIVLIAGLAVATTTSDRAAATPLTRPVHAKRAVSRTFVVTASDFAYRDLPVHARAGWVTLRMANAGHELHMFATAAVPHGYTAASLEAAILKGHAPDGVTEFGGPNAVAPGDTTSVSMFLPAGEYVVGCFVPSRDGTLHFMKGMMGSFDVVAAADTGAPPRSDERIMLSTYGIAMPGAAPKPGMRTFVVRNTAKETHDVVILKVLPGHTIAQALTWFAKLPPGAPAAVPVGGTTGIHTGDQVLVPAVLTPGQYVLVCWMTTNHKYHFNMGMQHAFIVPAT